MHKQKTAVRITADRRQQMTMPPPPPPPLPERQDDIPRTKGGFFSSSKDLPGPPDSHDLSTLREYVGSIKNIRSGADNWIGITCWLNVIGAVLAAPFTFGLSLFLILANAPIAALGCIATESKKQTRLMEVQVRLSMQSRGL